MRKISNNFIFVLIFNVLILNSLSIAEDYDSLSNSTEIEESSSSLLFLPFLFYSPETKFAGGIMANYIKNSTLPDTKPSSVFPALVYTQKNQIVASMQTEIYWDNSNYYFTGSISYLKFPSEYYGIGPNTSKDDKEEFTPEQFILDLGLKYQFFPDLYFGMGYSFEKFALIKMDEDGKLINRTTTGSNGGVISQVAVTAYFDTRDDIFWPSKGYLGNVIYGINDSFLGSDFDYTLFTADFRVYTSITESIVLANQLYYSRVNGNTPFHYLPAIGGSELMRGYYEGRYIDNNMYALQTEIRSPVWRKFGVPVT